MYSCLAERPPPPSVTESSYSGIESVVGRRLATYCGDRPSTRSSSASCSHATRLFIYSRALHLRELVLARAAVKACFSRSFSFSYPLVPNGHGFALQLGVQVWQIAAIRRMHSPTPPDPFDRSGKTDHERSRPVTCHECHAL